MPKVHLENNIDLRQESAPINCPQCINKPMENTNAMQQNHPFVLRFFFFYYYQITELSCLLTAWVEASNFIE